MSIATAPTMKNKKSRLPIILHVVALIALIAVISTNIALDPTSGFTVSLLALAGFASSIGGFLTVNSDRSKTTITTYTYYPHN